MNDLARRCCHHEAGHTAAHLQLGLAVEFVEVAADFSAGLARSLRPATTLRDRAVSALAGPAAELWYLHLRAGGRKDTDSVATALYEEQLQSAERDFSLARQSVHDSGGRAVRRRRWCREAVALVTKFSTWTRIERLAEALMRRRGRLYGDEVRAVIEGVRPLQRVRR